MTYQLPQALPDALMVNGKQYKRFGGKAAVERGFCKSNEDAWHYYVSAKAAALAGSIGDHQHFSVRAAKGRRCAHISMKQREGKPSDIMIWYRYDAHWTGSRTETVGLSQVIAKGMNNQARADRVDKATRVFNAFLSAMHNQATATPVLVAPVLVHMPATQSSYDADAEERAWEARNKPPVHASTPVPESFDNWDDD